MADSFWSKAGAGYVPSFAHTRSRLLPSSWGHEGEYIRTGQFHNATQPLMRSVQLLAGIRHHLLGKPSLSETPFAGHDVRVLVGDDL